METAQQKQKREQLDVDTISALKEAGSDLSKPHPLEHHFVVEELKIAQEVAKELQKDGYQISEILDGDDEGDIYYFFDAIKPCIVQPEIVFQESEKMTLLAKKYHVFYDGWGTKVIK